MCSKRDNVRRVGRCESRPERKRREIWENQEWAGLSAEATQMKVKAAWTSWLDELIKWSDVSCSLHATFKYGVSVAARCHWYTMEDRNFSKRGHHIGAAANFKDKHIWLLDHIHRCSLLWLMIWSVAFLLLRFFLGEQNPLLLDRPTAIWAEIPHDLLCHCLFSRLAW